MDSRPATLDVGNNFGSPAETQLDEPASIAIRPPALSGVFSSPGCKEGIGRGKTLQLFVYRPVEESRYRSRRFWHRGAAGRPAVIPGTRKPPFVTIGLGGFFVQNRHVDQLLTLHRRKPPIKTIYLGVNQRIFVRASKLTSNLDGKIKWLATLLFVLLVAA
jgi:hypothetical protein